MELFGFRPVGVSRTAGSLDILLREAGRPGPEGSLGAATLPAYNPDMAVQTQNRSQLFREARDHDHRPGTAGSQRLVAERRARNAVYQTTDGMTRELLRPVRD